MRALLIAAVMAAVATPSLAMSVSFSWGPTKKCFDRSSPPMTVSSVPDGTAKLRIRMVDLNAPGYPHGGGTVAWKGSGKLPYGAFRYQGPCPPAAHIYQFTVEALDAKGKVIGKASAKKRFP